MITVEKLLNTLKQMPLRSRVMITDPDEGTIRDIEVIELHPSDDNYWVEYERNNEKVVEIVVTKVDEYWEDIHKQRLEALREE